MGETKAAPNGARVVGLAVVLAGLWFAYRFTLGASQTQAAEGLDEISRKVAADAVTQYGIAKRSGKAMDACSAAGMVTAAFLQAKDEANYKLWRDTEAADCADAGVPR